MSPLNREHGLGEEVYKKLLDGANDAIYVIDPSTQLILDCNRRAAEMTGRPVSELIGTDPARLHPEEERDMLPGRFALTSERGSQTVTGLHHMNADGGPFPVEISASVVEVGNATLNLSVVRDITDRMEASRRLQESESRFRAFMENLPGLAYMKDAEGRHVYVTPAFERIFGISSAEWEGKRNGQLFPQAVASQLDEADAKVLKGHSVTMVRENVGGHDWESYKFPIEKPGGEVWLGGISIDITEQLGLAAELDELSILNQAMLQSAPTGYIIYSSDGQCILASRAAGDIIGATREQVLSQNWRELESWKQSGLARLAAACMATGESRRETVHILTTFGKDVYLDCQFVRFEAHGEQHMMLVYLDDTERQRLIADLRAKEEQVRTVYADVLASVTQGKLIVSTREEAIESLSGDVVAEFEVPDAEALRDARASLAQVMSDELTCLRSPGEAILAFGEAITNGVKHAGSCHVTIHRVEGTEEVCESMSIVVTDEGPGIDFAQLPRAALMTGFSTKRSLGLGFTVMIELCDRVLLATDGRGTTVVLEFGCGTKSLEPKLPAAVGASLRFPKPSEASTLRASGAETADPRDLRGPRSGRASGGSGDGEPDPRCL